MRQQQTIRRPRRYLVQNLCLGLLEVVEAMFDVEDRFHAEVPLLTIEDLVDYLAEQVLVGWV